MTPNTLPVPNLYLSKHPIEMSKICNGFWRLLFLPDQSQPLYEKLRHLGYFCRLSLDRYLTTQSPLSREEWASDLTYAEKMMY